MDNRFCRLCLALCLALIAACERKAERREPLEAEAPPQASSAAAGEPEAGVRLALLRPSNDMDMAALEGVLHVDGPCLYIVGNDKAGSRTLPVFHIAGLRWDQGTRTLRVRDEVFAPGQRVSLGGGEPANPAALPWVQRPHPSCDSSDLFVAGQIRPAPPRRGR